MAAGPAQDRNRTPVLLQGLALVVLGAILLLNTVFLPLFLAAAALWMYLFHLTAVQKKASYALVTVIFGSIAGLLPVLFQRYALLFDLFGTAGGVLLRGGSAAIAAVFLLGSAYLLRKQQYPTRTVFLPYVITVLMSVAAYFTTLKMLSATASAPFAGGLSFASIPNLCSVGRPENIVCGLCPVLGLGNGMEHECFFQSMAVIGILLSGIVSGYVYGQNGTRLTKTLYTAAPPAVGIILLVLLLNFL